MTLGDIIRMEAKVKEQAAEIERLTFELAVASEPSPYCPICGSCGIAGCCGPKRCLYPTTDQDDQIETLEAEIEKLRDVVKMCLDELYAPDPNCSCHISPPCNDCVDYSSIREVQDIALAALGETE